MIKNILIVSILAGAGIFIYNKWIKSEKTSGFLSGYVPVKKVEKVESKSNACGCGA